MKNSPKVSIILPSFNQSWSLADAIQSVLDQTYSDWELVIVDDGSTDNTSDVITQFDEPRIRYIYQNNKGASEARNTGMASAKGEYFAFIDGDDRYDPRKIEIQTIHLDQDPEVGATYVSQIQMDRDGNLLNLKRAAAEVNLEKFVLGFPFSPTDFMVRRHWLDRVGGFDKSLVINEDRDIYIRLALAGCRFSRIDDFLAYRRLDANRKIQDLPARLADMLRALASAFNNMTYQADIESLYNRAHRNIYLLWTFQAAVQDETSLAQEYFRQVLRLDPLILDDDAKNVLKSLVHFATRAGGEHELLIRKVVDHLSTGLVPLIDYCNWAVARGFLIRGARDIMWSRLEQGKTNLAKAAEQGAQLDEPFIRGLIDQLMSYEIAYGPGSSEKILQDLAYYLKPLDAQAALTSMMGNYSINRAFRDYKRSEYEMVPTWVIQAILNNPKYIANKGVLVIFFHSIFQRFY